MTRYRLELAVCTTQLEEVDTADLAGTSESLEHVLDAGLPVPLAKKDIGGKGHRGQQAGLFARLS